MRMGIVLALAILFGALELLWPHTSLGTSGPQVATIQPAFDREQANDNDLNGKLDYVKASSHSNGDW